MPLPDEINSFANLLAQLHAAVQTQQRRIDDLETQLRSLSPNHSPPTSNPSQLHFGPLLLDRSSHRILLDGHPIHLTPIEFDILRVFLEHPDQAMTRDQLFELATGKPIGDTGTRTIDVYIRHLRQALDNVGQHIETVRGIGYRFSPQTHPHHPQ
ncbi:MAG: winged helix-turn-helix transcriptional regulator [Magnetococcales bacterium]|nr:winged helix-turn-helix transcriptional regulator [Magnetococcales bacterium]